MLDLKHAGFTEGIDRQPQNMEPVEHRAFLLRTLQSILLFYSDVARGNKRVGDVIVGGKGIWFKQVAGLEGPDFRVIFSDFSMTEDIKYEDTMSRKRVAIVTKPMFERGAMGRLLDKFGMLEQGEDEIISSDHVVNGITVDGETLPQFLSKLLRGEQMETARLFSFSLAIRECFDERQAWRQPEVVRLIQIEDILAIFHRHMDTFVPTVSARLSARFGSEWYIEAERLLSNLIDEKNAKE